MYEHIQLGQTGLYSVFLQVLKNLKSTDSTFLKIVLNLICKYLKVFLACLRQ